MAIDDAANARDLLPVDLGPGAPHRALLVRSQELTKQVDAVTGAVLGVATRRSDWFEQLHDGSLFGDWVHDWIMPMVALALAFLVLSGLYMWYFPIWKKNRRIRTLRRS